MDEQAWVAPDGHRMSFSFWASSTSEPRGNILALHGFSGRDSDFEPVVPHLNRLGFNVIAPNLRGSGMESNPDKRGDIASFEQWMDDLESFVALWKDEDPETPWILLGESLGGMLAIHCLAHQEDSFWEGLVLLAPFVAFQEEPGFWEKWFYRVFRRLTPQRLIYLDDLAPEGVDSIPVARDPERQRQLMDADHYLEAVRLRYLGAIVDGVERVPEAWRKANVPTLVLYAGKDVFVDAEVVQSFFEFNRPESLPFLKLRRFEEAYHLLLFDPLTPEVIEEIERFLLREDLEETR